MVITFQKKVLLYWHLAKPPIHVGSQDALMLNFVLFYFINILHVKWGGGKLHMTVLSFIHHQALK